MNTRERILETALLMFSSSGYEAGSIRDICGQVGIKESSLYYHFKSKREILDTMLLKFKEHVGAILDTLCEESAAESEGLIERLPVYFFDGYLLDPFCNKVMRVLMIEQFHNEEIRREYERFFFIEPQSIIESLFSALAEAGIVAEVDAHQSASDFLAHITALMFKYLMNGELTEAKKYAFCKEALDYMEPYFMSFTDK